ncbi:MAG: hypothetical protein NWF08_05935 [Candidatus Bathyarchaeota archaeon]|nr:hypothetical protein [Candidatus Bathyarchaeota archaeon]
MNNSPKIDYFKGVLAGAIAGIVAGLVAIACQKIALLNRAFQPQVSEAQQI